MVAAPQIPATLSKCLAFFSTEHLDLWSRETRTAAPSNPHSHGDLCLGANVENGYRGPADLPSSALKPDFIHSRKCVSIWKISSQLSLLGMICCSIFPRWPTIHRFLTRDLWLAYSLKCEEIDFCKTFFLFARLSFLFVAFYNCRILLCALVIVRVSERMRERYRDKDIDGDRELWKVGGGGGGGGLVQQILCLSARYRDCIVCGSPLPTGHYR